MSETVDYPNPHQDEDNRPFIEGWKEGRLMLQRSRSGGPFFFYPRPICPFTGSRDLIWVEASGNGKIVSFSLVMRPNHPAFASEVPIILAEIMLEEGASLLARVIEPETARIHSGAQVTILKMPEAARYSMPTFRLV
jgi:uncharacterized protein